MWYSVYSDYIETITVYNCWKKTPTPNWKYIFIGFILNSASHSYRMTDIPVSVLDLAVYVRRIFYRVRIATVVITFNCAKGQRYEILQHENTRT